MLNLIIVKMVIMTMIKMMIDYNDDGSRDDGDDESIREDDNY